VTYKEALKYPLKLMEYKIIQKVIIYSIGGIFILLTISQNLNLIAPSLFTPEIIGCKDFTIEHTLTHKIYKIIKAFLYDILQISAFGWFLHKYKFCSFTLTAFYAFVIVNVSWSALKIFEVNSFIIDVCTTTILNIAWIVYIYQRIKQ